MAIRPLIDHVFPPGFWDLSPREQRGLLVPRCEFAVMWHRTQWAIRCPYCPGGIWHVHGMAGKQWGREIVGECRAPHCAVPPRPGRIARGGYIAGECVAECAMRVPGGIKVIHTQRELKKVMRSVGMKGDARRKLLAWYRWMEP